MKSHDSLTLMLLFVLAANATKSEVLGVIMAALAACYGIMSILLLCKKDK